jgi:hypothetical protein
LSPRSRLAERGSSTTEDLKANFTVAAARARFAASRKEAGRATPSPKLTKR